MPPPRRDAPSSQWRSVILEKQHDSANTKNHNNVGGKSSSSRKVLHANWIHATRSILLTVSEDSSVWIVDLDYFQSQQQQNVSCESNDVSKIHNNNPNMKKTNGGEISFQINSRLGAIAATSIRSTDEHYTLVGNEIVNEIYGCRPRNNYLNVVCDAYSYYALGAVATKSGLVSTFSCSATSPTLQTWNLKSTNNNNVEDDATKSIHQIQVSPKLNSDNSTNQSCQVTLLVWSKVGNSIFVCCCSPSSSSSTFVHRIAGSDWILGSKISSLLCVSGGFSHENSINKQNNDQGAVVASFWVSRGREIQKLSIHSSQKDSSSPSSSSIRGVSEPLGETSPLLFGTSSSSSFTLPFLFFAEDVVGIREIGPFNLEKKSHGNSSKCSSTQNENALLITRAGTARILMRRSVAQMMGVTTNSSNNTNASGDGSTSNNTINTNSTGAENLTDDEKYVKEWIEMMKEAKQQSSNINSSHQNNRYRQTNDGFFSQEEMESNNKSNNYGDSFQASSSSSPTNASQNVSKGKIKLESVCTCEVPGGDGYIRSIDVSPSGSVVALAFESGVIVVGFVAMKASPAATNSMDLTSSNNNTFYIPVVPQLLFVARTVSRIPKKASSLLVVDERRASLLSLDAAGVLELLIFPSALRRQQSSPLSGEEDTSLRKIAAAMMLKNNNNNKSQSPSSSSSTLFSSNYEFVKSNSTHNNNNRLQSPQHQVVGTSKLFSSGPKIGDLRKEMQTTFSSCVERVAAVQRAGPLDDASVKGLPPIRTPTCVGRNNMNSDSAMSSSNRNNKTAALASSVCGELEKIKTAVFSQVLLHVSRLLSSNALIENNNPETFLTTVILLYLKVNRLLLQGTEMYLPSSSATSILRSNNNISRVNKNLKNNSRRNMKQIQTTESENDDNDNDEIIAKRIVDSLLRQDEPHFASGMTEDLSLFSSRRTSAAISLESFLVSGIFLPNFSPYTSVTTRDEYFLVHTVMMLLTHQHINQGATSNSTIMSAARLFSTVHSRGSKLLNLVETARAQAFAASAPSFGPSTAATKIKLWKTLMAQKMKKMFQQKKPSINNNNHNENKKNNYKKQVGNNNNVINRKMINNNNNGSSQRQLSSSIMISSLAHKILREFDLEWIRSLREKMILLRYLVDDDATAVYCSSLINAP